MEGDANFAELIRQVRLGDSLAAERLVRQYEAAVRGAVRSRLTDPTLKRQFDDEDLCQSVMGSFFVRAASGQYDLDAPQQLIALLTRMAHNKVSSKARYVRQQCRDERQTTTGLDDLLTVVRSTEADPQRQAAGRELLQKVMSAFTAEERRVAECRAAGCSWNEVAQYVGGTAEARRKQLERALTRVSEELGVQAWLEDEE